MVLLGSVLSLAFLALLPTLTRALSRVVGLDGTVGALVVLGVLVAAGLLLHVSPAITAFVVGFASPLRNRFVPPRLPLVHGASELLLAAFIADAATQGNLLALGPTALALAGLLLVIAVAVKWVGTRGAARAVGMSDDRARALTALMNCRGILILVVAQQALDESIVTPSAVAVAALLAVATTAATAPWLARTAAGRSLALESP